MTTTTRTSIHHLSGDAVRVYRSGGKVADTITLVGAGATDVERLASLAAFGRSITRQAEAEIAHAEREAAMPAESMAQAVANRQAARVERRRAADERAAAAEARHREAAAATGYAIATGAA